MDVEPLLTRRSVLCAGIAAVGTAGVACLAGCSRSTATKAGSAGTGPGATGSAGSGSGGGSGGGGGAGQVLAKVSDVPIGNAISAMLDGNPVLISQPSAGDVVVFTAVCTHMGCTVEPAGKEFHCPCHGSVYDAATGQVLHGPAPAALAKIPSHVAAGQVIAGA